MKPQSPLMSLIESVASTAVGFVIALATTMVVLPLFGYPVTYHDGLGITFIFTVISILRSYAMRRLFNHLHHRERNLTP